MVVILQHLPKHLPPHLFIVQINVIISKAVKRIVMYLKANMSNAEAPFHRQKERDSELK
jgi:hypothetical protein